MTYHAIYHEDKAVIRKQDDGINDLEWHYGCRIIRMTYNREFNAAGYIKSIGYEVLNRDEWNEYMNTLDDDLVPNNNFVYPTVHDKWDTQREIY